MIWRQKRNDALSDRSYQTPDSPPNRLEVAQVVADRPLQVLQVVEQPVVRRPAAQHPPEPLDGVQVRAVARQPVELQVWVLRQGVVDRPAPVPGALSMIST